MAAVKAAVTQADRGMRNCPNMRGMGARTEAAVSKDVFRALESRL